MISYNVKYSVRVALLKMIVSVFWFTALFFSLRLYPLEDSQKGPLMVSEQA